MDITGKKVAVLVSNYFEQAEFEEPISALKDAGAEVTVISTETKELQGLNHIDKGDKFEADLLLKQASSDDYDALVLPGGAINADALRMDEGAQRWVIEFLESNRPLAVICHAPWVLVSADVVDGKRLTSYHTIQDDIRNAGGSWANEKLVIDNNLITSRQPDDLPDFNDALIKMLNGSKPVASEKSFYEQDKVRSLGYDIEKDELNSADRADLLEDDIGSEPDEFHLNQTLVHEERRGY